MEEEEQYKKKKQRIKDDFDVGKNKKKTGLENLENESNLERVGS